ncbi:hypothetical protein M3M50_10895 [Pseudomonas bijieensis]|uniref:phage tailspike polysaccharide lyase family protein n=1 Tax=Pseudomonas bijieensis TaxID=2681983 RepID=UPI00200FC21B|nr:hypothetical protein [Pseudomonas bijieensis]UQI33105.1 hypothetical protein M3M50_10895 [Pseudomonas bijieensis]
MTITYRVRNGAPLSWAQVDENFRTLETEKVSAQPGYGLSQENFSSTYKQTLDDLPSNLEFRLEQAEDNAAQAVIDSSAADQKASIVLAPDEFDKGPGAIPYDSSLGYPSWSLGNALKLAAEGGDLREDMALPDGSGLMGFDQLTAYPAGTVGARLKEIPHLDLSAASDKAQALMDFAVSLDGKTGRVEPGTYIMSKQVNLPGNVDLDLTGVVLDFSAADIANFPDLICVKPASGSLTLLPPLSSGTTIGQFTLPFSLPHSLAAGDALILWDDTAFSYSGFRTNYYQGQFAVVRSASGLNANLTASILATMPSTIKVYKMNPSRPKIKGGDILMPTTGVFIAGLLCDIARNPEFDSVRVFGTSGGGIIQQRTLGGTVTRCETYSDREGVAADNYGLGFSNSQHCLAMGGTFHARRHGVTMGGTDLPGSVPTRFCVVDGADISSWDIQCADMHGNVEHCEYVNCTMHNGVTISGNHNSVRSSTIFAPALASTGNGVAISINEMRGTNFSFESLKNCCVWRSFDHVKSNH